ncbi:hypothetical protein MPH_08476 [Macrophomina phaseolina MS6]|uniref:Uncharacterized protein n=1 Tax=Macrophomina phaseolina (strain MS6) TaxID=1126212 RepID=K2RVY1_MACPH|nr:hypothetical protein MPH_08476 [Macrophomina phaseolina MS6]
MVLRKLDEAEQYRRASNGEPAVEPDNDLVIADGGQSPGVFGTLKRVLFGSGSNTTSLPNPSRRGEIHGSQLQASGISTTQHLEAMRFWPDLQELLSCISNAANVVTKEQKVLQSLYDPALVNRYFDVDEQYGNTFRWIFDNLEHGFPEWLETGNGVYWITGKVGSGKSTLMKFIMDDSRTENMLNKWAAGAKILIVHHFFWAAGAELQRSYDGLLRSLLFQILRNRPSLIPNLCARRIEGDEFTLQEPWSVRELTSTFRRLTEEGSLDISVCIFVDGLDEYNGNPSDVINILNELASKPGFKLCVSSRPWPVFQKEFGHLIAKLRMEDLTRNDIEQYVEGRLNGDRHFQSICRTKEDASNMVFKITWLAEGVFLWVKYVVNLLLRDTANEPTYSDLIKRITNYPRDLDTLYERMLNMIEDSYPQEASEIFQVLSANLYDTKAIVPVFMELERKDPKYALRPQDDLRAEVNGADIDAIEARVKARCMDFVELRRELAVALETTDASDSTMAPASLQHSFVFAHRSAQEFLERKHVWLQQHTRPGFDVHISLWRSYLACIKASPYEVYDRHYHQYMKLYALGVIDVMSQSVERFGKILVEESNETFLALTAFVKWAQRSISHTTASDTGVNILANEDADDIVLAWIADAGTWHSFTYKLSLRGDSWLTAERAQSVLDILIHTRVSRFYLGWYFRNTPDPKIVKTLLNAGADPNRPMADSNGISCWFEFLSSFFADCSSDHEGMTPEDFRPAIEVFLDHGADPNAQVRMEMESGPGGSWNSDEEEEWRERLMTIDEILGAHYSPNDPIFQLLKERRKKRYRLKRLLRGH